MPGRPCRSRRPTPYVLVRAGGQELAVLREGDGLDDIGHVFERVHRLEGGHVPDGDLVFPGTRAAGQKLAVGTERRRPRLTAPVLERVRFPGRGDVDDDKVFERAVHAGLATWGHAEGDGGCGREVDQPLGGGRGNVVQGDGRVV